MTKHIDTPDLRIKAVCQDVIRSIGGGYSMTIRIKTADGVEEIELRKSCLGHFTIDQGIGVAQ